MHPRPNKRRAAHGKRSWAFNVLAPWAIGVGALVSFTADAGQDSVSDWNIAPLTARIRATRGLEQEHSVNFSAAATGDLGEAKFNTPLIKEAELVLSGKERADIGLEENEPHGNLKGDGQNSLKLTVGIRAIPQSAFTQILHLNLQKLSKEKKAIS